MPWTSAWRRDWIFDRDVPPGPLSCLEHHNPCHTRYNTATRSELVATFVWIPPPPTAGFVPVSPQLDPHTKKLVRAWQAAPPLRPWFETPHKGRFPLAEPLTFARPRAGKDLPQYYSVPQRSTCATRNEDGSAGVKNLHIISSSRTDRVSSRLLCLRSLPGSPPAPIP